MSVLWVMTTIARPFSSKIARKCTSALSNPRSEVACRPVRYQYWIEGTCGTSRTW